MEAESRFRAMGSDVHVVIAGGSLGLLEDAREMVERLEGLWSRFRPDSEVSRLNDLAGLPVPVSPETLALVQRAVEGAGISAGRFDPTVLGAVIRSGYDRSFELLTDEAPDPSSPLGLGYDDIEIDPKRSTVRLPFGVGFDPGGIGKGYAADLLADHLLREGAAGACVNIGGDLRVAGESPAGGPWTLAIEHPFAGRPMELIGLEDGAVATSTRTRRVWGPEGDRRHHLIDPSTGLPARTGLASATVIAAQAWQAEVVAKAAFVAGLSEGLFVLASTHTEGLLVDDGGSVYPSFGFSRFAAPSARAYRKGA